eukprot:7275790-Lingulodinium_polyedra.AAC.1
MHRVSANTLLDCTRRPCLNCTYVHLRHGCQRNQSMDVDAVRRRRRKLDIGAINRVSAKIKPV